MSDSAAGTRKIDIWHDPEGRIVAWGYVPADAPDYLVAEPIARADRVVLTVTVAEEHLPTLHETHLVDAGSLRRRASSA
jgi:hypothetical protein